MSLCTGKSTWKVVLAYDWLPFCSVSLRGLAYLIYSGAPLLSEEGSLTDPAALRFLRWIGRIILDRAKGTL